MITTTMPNVTLARRRFNRGDLQQACEGAFDAARLAGRRTYVGSKYGGYFVTATRDEARGTSNTWFEVTPMGRVTKAEDHP